MDGGRPQLQQGVRRLGREKNEEWRERERAGRDVDMSRTIELIAFQPLHLLLCYKNSLRMLVESLWRKLRAGCSDVVRRGCVRYGPTQSILQQSDKICKFKCDFSLLDIIEAFHQIRYHFISSAVNLHSHWFNPCLTRAECEACRRTSISVVMFHALSWNVICN